MKKQESRRSILMGTSGEEGNNPRTPLVEPMKLPEKSGEEKVIMKVFQRLDKKQDDKIDKEELLELLQSLGYEPSKMNQYGVSEVEHMIWEVDDDSDGCVGVEEFVEMWKRCRADKTGLEPRKLYNVCQFLSLDRNGDGTVSTEECMEMILQRYGREKLDTVFSGDQPHRSITLSEFLTHANAPPLKRTSKGAQGNKALALVAQSQKPSYGSVKQKALRK